MYKCVTRCVCFDFFFLKLGRLTKLETLELSGNEFSGQLPTTLGNLHRSLKGFLGLDKNRFKGSIPSQLFRLTAVDTLSLAHNKLSMPLPTEMGGMTGLTSLFLGNNKIRGSLPSELGNLVNLKQYLDLESNSLTGLIPSQVWIIARKNQIFKLN